MLNESCTAALSRRKKTGCRMMKWGGSAILVFAVSGCLSRPSLVRRSFAFQTPQATTGRRTATNAPILELRQVRVASTFDGQSFVYRTGSFSYEHDPYAEFLVPPAEALASPIRGYLRHSGLFRAVIRPDNVLPPDVVLEVFVSRLYGDLRESHQPAAVLGLRVLFTRVGQGASSRVLLQRNYLRRIPVKTRTAAAIMAGWNKGLQQILSQVVSDWKKGAPVSHPAWSGKNSPTRRIGERRSGS